MFWALSQNEEWYLERVSVVIAVGPVTNLENSKS